MKVLVVGGAGYIGGAVTDALLKQNVPFTVYDSLLYEYLYLKPVDFIFGDIRDTKKLKELLPGYTHVIWLAAVVGDPACQIKPELTVSVNRDAVKWLSENYDGRIIFLSTCSVYGQHDEVLDENSPTNPLSLYAQTKLEAETYLKNKDALILRLGTVFGVADAFSRMRMDLAVNYMTANALKKGALSIFGGSQWRPFIHVKDVGKAVVDSLEKDSIGIYNLASFNVQIRDLGGMINKITGCKVQHGEQKFQDARNYRVNTGKALTAGIFNPKYARTIESGVREIMDLIQNGRIRYTESDIYFNERHIANLIKNNELK